MDPSTEQLIRDYLNRMSVAARGRLDAAARRHLLGRVRESIEREAGLLPAADPAAVRKILSGLGQPEVLVKQEHARLAAARAEAGLAAPRPGRLPVHPPAWLTRRSTRRDRPVYVPPEPDPASAAPLTGEIRIQSRPISARRRPGAPLPPPRQVRQRRPPLAGTPAGQQNGSVATTGTQETPTAPPAVAGPAAVRPEPAEPGGGNWDRLLGMLAGKPDTAPGAGPDQPGGQDRGHDGGQDSGPAASGPRAWPHRQSSTSSSPSQSSSPSPSSPSSPSSPPSPSSASRLHAGGGTRPGVADSSTVQDDVSASLGNLASAAVLLARQRPLETAAIVLLGLGGLIFPPVWLFGALVALVSPHWDFRDKWAGLAGPPLLVILGAGAAVALGGKHASIGGYAHEAWVSADYLSRVLAVIAAAYLTWRVKRGPRPPATPPWNRPHRI